MYLSPRDGPVAKQCVHGELRGNDTAQHRAAYLARYSERLAAPNETAAKADGAAAATAGAADGGVGTATGGVGRAAGTATRAAATAGAAFGKASESRGGTANREGHGLVPLITSWLLHPHTEARWTTVGIKSCAK